MTLIETLPGESDAHLRAVTDEILQTLNPAKPNWWHPYDLRGTRHHGGKLYREFYCIAGSVEIWLYKLATETKTREVLMLASGEAAGPAVQPAVAADRSRAMDPESTTKPVAPILGYADTGRARKPYSLLAFFAGVSTPYAYAAVALVVISPFGFRGSGFEAFYALHPAAITAIAAFPLLVWQIGRRIRYRGFVRGVVVGTLVLPLLAIVALAISFTNGV